MTRGFRLGVGDSSVACGVAPRGDRATKNPRLAERGLFVPPKVSASNLAPFIGGAAAKVNLERVLSGAMALGLAGPTKGGPHDHFHRRRAASHWPRQDRERKSTRLNSSH